MRALGASGGGERPPPGRTPGPGRLSEMVCGYQFLCADSGSGGVTGKGRAEEDSDGSTLRRREPPA